VRNPVLWSFHVGAATRNSRYESGRTSRVKIRVRNLNHSSDTFFFDPHGCRPPRPACVVNSARNGLEISKMLRYEAGLGARLYREKGYISQPIPIATNRKAKKAHTA